MIFFRMPQLKAHTSFLASISQPVYSPTIRFNYPAEKYDVKMYPFSIIPWKQALSRRSSALVIAI